MTLLCPFSLCSVSWMFSRVCGEREKVCVYVRQKREGGEGEKRKVLLTMGNSDCGS